MLRMLQFTGKTKYALGKEQERQIGFNEQNRINWKLP